MQNFTQLLTSRNPLYTKPYIVEELQVILQKTIDGYTDDDHVEDLKSSIKLINCFIELFNDVRN